MYLREEVKAKIQQFAAKYPMPVGENALQSWTHQLCEQLAYSFPSDGWCHKASGIGASHSKDTIAINQLGGSFIGWDIIVGAGTTAPVLDLSGTSTDLTGQYPEPVTPTNWIGGTPPPPITNLEERVTQLEADMRDVEHALRDAAAILNNV